VNGPSQGSVSLAADGSFTYTPGPAFTTSDTFTYKATQGTQDSNIATVTIRLNSPPVANNNSYVATLNTTLNVAAPGVSRQR